MHDPQVRAARIGRGPQANRGQVLVVFALAITVLFAAAGLAFDVGRFYSEKRFLQNAADAAALAAANALIRGETVAQADVRAREVLTVNFAHSPSGVVPTLPPASPVYESGHAGDPDYLINGILINGSDVRVAVQNPVGFTFGRIVGLDSSTIGGRARALTNGALMPIGVRHYVHPPGPTAGASSPCPGDQTAFMDFFSTADTSCLGTDSNAALRTIPTAGNAFDSASPGSDPSHHGPDIAILGQGAQPNNGADFRGFLALDIRNFQANGTQVYYNGVTAATNPTTLKGMEAAWVRAGGYPGPQFPPVIVPPDPMDQVATMNGNSTGVVIDEIIKRFVPGQDILIAVYSGSVMAIPDFTMTPPAMISLPATGLTVNAGSMKVSRNQAFSGTVTLSTLADTLDPANPMVLGTLVGASPFTYSPNPMTPPMGSGATVNLMNATTLGASPGIYTLWVQGQAGSPYLTTKYEPFPLKIGTVTRDFTVNADASIKVAAAIGGNVTFTINVLRSGTAFGGPVSLSLDTPLPTGMGATSFSPTSVTPGNGGGTPSTLSINTGTMAPGRHRIVVRATGMNGDATPRKVTHLLQLWVDVATGGGSNQEYIDIEGFAVMRITSMTTNTVNAYAITEVIADPNDPRLHRGQAARLVPWN